MSVEQDLDRLTGRLDKVVDLLQGVAGEFDTTKTRADGFGKKAKESAEKAEKSYKNLFAQIATSSKFLRNTITAIPDELSTSFEKSFKIVGNFQNRIYITSKFLGQMNTDLKDVSKTQKIYRNEIERISQKTKLSILESQSLFDTLNSGFTGLKTESAIRQMSDITENVARLGLTAQETQKLLSGMGSAMNFAEVRRAMSGVASGADKQKIAFAVRMGVLSREQAFTTLTTNEQAGVGATTGRNAAILEAGRRQATEDRYLAEAEAVTSMELVQNYVKTGEALNKFYQSLSKVTARFEALATITDDLSRISSTKIGAFEHTTGALGYGASMLAIGAGALSKGGKGGGLLGKAAQAVSGNVAGAAMVATGNATPVYIVGVAPGVSGFGPLGAGSLASGGKTSEVVEEVAKGSIMGWLAQKAGMMKSGVGAGAKIGLGKLPIIGALLSGAFEGMTGNYDFTGARVSAGLTTMGSAWGGALGGATAGAALGSVIPGVGTAIGGVGGAIAGGLGGTYIGSALSRYLFGSVEEKKTSDILDDVENIGDKTKRNSDLQKGHSEELKKGADNSAEALLHTEEIEVQLGLMVLAAEKFRTTIDSAVSSMSNMPVLGMKTAEQMRLSADAMDYALKQLKEKEKVLEKDLQTAKASKDEEKAKVAEMALQANQAEQMNSYYAQQQMYISAMKKPFEDATKMQEIKVGLAAEELKRNEALRMGIGVSYQDTVRTVAALSDKVKLEREAARYLAEQAKIAEDPEMQMQLEYEAAQAQERALQAETQMLNEAKSMREGYLDAMQETVAGLGAYAKLLPQQGKGNQFFADTPSLGRVADSMESASESLQDPIRYTTLGPTISQGVAEGITRGMAEYSQYGMAGMWNLIPALGQLFGPMGAATGLAGRNNIPLASGNNLSSAGVTRGRFFDLGSIPSHQEYTMRGGGGYGITLPQTLSLSSYFIPKSSSSEDKTNTIQEAAEAIAYALTGGDNKLSLGDLYAGYGGDIKNLGTIPGISEASHSLNSNLGTFTIFIKTDEGQTYTHSIPLGNSLIKNTNNQ